MARRARALVLLTVAAAVVVFAVVQDRVAAAGIRRYVALQRAAINGEARPVTIDEIMRPAVERSVEQGLLWAGVVLLAGIGAVAAISRRPPGE